MNREINKITIDEFIKGNLQGDELFFQYGNGVAFLCSAKGDCSLISFTEFSWYFSLRKTQPKTRPPSEKKVAFYSIHDTIKWHFIVEVYFYAEEFVGVGKDGDMLQIYSYFDLAQKKEIEQEEFKKLYQKYSAPLERYRAFCQFINHEIEHYYSINNNQPNNLKNKEDYEVL